MVYGAYGKLAKDKTMPLKVKILNPLATAPTIAHPGEDLGFDLYALRVLNQPVKEDGTPVNWRPAAPGMPTRLDMNGKVVHPIRIEAGKPLLVSTGIAVHFVPSGKELKQGLRFGLLLRDRSSLAASGIFVTAGVIDAGYRGELKVIMNLSTGSYQDMWPGDKIAQLIPFPIYADAVETVEDLEESARKEGGFGSTGA